MIWKWSCRLDYIIIDLEWNQCPEGREQREENLPFEIIEIGAVKLDENRQPKGKFHRVIKPQVYLNIHQQTQKIIHMDEEELEQGEPFERAVKAFFDWCGEDCRFGTWGSMDLVELQRNMEYFGVEGVIGKPFFYYDVQKLFSLEVEGHKHPHTLEYAVEYYHLEKQEDFHRALADARYTARVFQKISKEIVERYFSIDYYYPPKCKEDEVYVDYGTYTKFISREYDSKEAILRDKKIRALECFHCHKKLRKRVNWFTNSIKKNYYCVGYCEEHGYLKGRLRIYRTKAGRYFVVKIVSETTPEEAGELKARGSL
jgi:inhibitor of KinA sporulation pathway (predicted exonuclease)